MAPPADRNVTLDDVPWSDTITAYDEAHFVVYLRLLDADADGATADEMARIVLGIDSEIGAAWRSQPNGGEGKPYLSVSLDDPCLPNAVHAVLFEDAEKRSAQLVWSRRRTEG